MVLQPFATYRIRLRPSFSTSAAADVVDPSQVNGELGGAEKHARLRDIHKAAETGHLIDTAPNPPGGIWYNILTDEQIEEHALRLTDWLNCFPVWLLAKKE